jgi:hypothetical protein
MPHAVIGYVRDSAGNAVPSAAVTLTNGRTGASMSVTANLQGQYQADLSSLSGAYQVGDVITVEAVSGTLEGSSEVIVTSGAIDQCDVAVAEATAFFGIPLIALAIIVLSVLAGLFMAKNRVR